MTKLRDSILDVEMRRYCNICIKAYSAEFYFGAAEYACALCNTYLSRNVYAGDNDVMESLVTVFKNTGCYRNAETLESLIHEIEQGETSIHTASPDDRLFEPMHPLITEDKRAEIRALNHLHDNKYCRNFDENFRRAVGHYIWMSPAKGAKILDIGTGFGFFPYICKQNFHTVQTIDIEGVPPEFQKSTSILGVPVTPFSIEKFKPIVEFPYKFDVVNCLQICFNNHMTTDLWGTKEWSYFLVNLHDTILNDDGFVWLGFNFEEPDSATGQPGFGDLSVEKMFEPYRLDFKGTQKMQIARLAKSDITAFM